MGWNRVVWSLLSVVVLLMVGLDILVSCLHVGGCTSGLGFFSDFNRPYWVLVIFIELIC